MDENINQKLSEELSKIVKQSLLENNSEDNSKYGYSQVRNTEDMINKMLASINQTLNAKISLNLAINPQNNELEAIVDDHNNRLTQDMSDSNQNQTTDNDNSPESDIIKDLNKNNETNIRIAYNDVLITEDQINDCICVPLQVRRGSEPVLNTNSPEISHYNDLDANKRWSTAVAIDSKINKISSTHSLDASYEHSDEDKDKSVNSNSLSPRSIKEEGYGSEEKSEHTPSSTSSSNTFSRFSRGSGRLSMIANNLDVWVEAADRQMTKTKRDNSPVKDNTNGLNRNVNNISKHLNYELGESPMSSISSEDNTKYRKSEPTVMVKLAKESGPLGIHVVPDNDDNGLLIQGIEPGGRIDRDGRLHVGDTIIEINNQSILSVDFERAQEIFRIALQSDEITLKLFKYTKQQSNTSPKKPFPPPVLPKPQNIIKQHEQLRLESGMVEGEERVVQHTKVATVTPTKKLIGSTTPHKPTTAVSTALSVANTRKIGKKYHIQLRKGKEGLGFSITTRDNPTGVNSPIYIKTILPIGAAVEDGRLRTGDRLLEVCGIEMTGKSQDDAVKILRTIPLGTTVDLIVSRQESDLSPSPMLPRQLPPDKAVEHSLSSSYDEREVLTFEIPLNDTGSAGLGVSVKGKTSSSSGQIKDMGIFVKGVINGGAASKDGRLLTNDQLININGIPLLCMTNSQAMETLRRAMIQSEVPIANPNAITLTVARRMSKQSDNSFHQRNDSLISATSNESFNDEIFSPNNEMFTNKFDDTCDSYKSNENTVIFRPKPDSENRESVNQIQPVIDQSSSNQTFSKMYYLSENHDSNAIHDKSNLLRTDVIIERDKPNSNKDVNKETAPRDSQLSLSEENEDGFRRDGFGRQSMSEKRHAQLDAKNTDTYRRNKKTKEDKDKQRDRSESREKTYNLDESNVDSQTPLCHHESVPNNIVVIQRSASDESLTLMSPSVNKIVSHNTDRIKVVNGCRAKLPKNTVLFSPACCWKCQSPGSCPYHSNQVNRMAKEIGPSLGMKKSSSLESLQTMMQDLQKEQLESVGAFSSPRHSTVRVARSRETNESFRVAVDRSYDAPNGEPQETMETLAEEGSDSGSSVGHQTHINQMRPSGALSMASTQYTATTATSSQLTTADDETTLFKKKNSVKKKGLLKTLFNFGSKKGRSSPAKNVNDRQPVGEPNADQINDQINSKNAAQMYILEQERIQMHYKRLIEQQKQQQLQQQQQSNQVSQSAQPTPPARQRSKTSINKRIAGPLHSTPTGVTSGQMTNTLPLSNEALLSKNERMQQLRAQHQRQHAERQRQYPDESEIYETNAYSMDRKPICGSDVIHTRGNSYDIYRQGIERAGYEGLQRPGSRVGIADHNSKYSHYMNYKEIQQQMHQYHQQQQHSAEQYRHIYGQTGNPLPQEPQPVIQMMRNQHQRQVSSPVNHRTERPNSNYYEYESVNAIKNMGLLNQQQMQLQKQYNTQQNNVNNNSSQNKHLTHSLNRRTHKYKNGDNLQTVPIRQQQPIYQTNQLEIYGTNYANGYSAQPNQASVPIYETFHPNNNNNNNMNGRKLESNDYQIASKYQSLRPGSKV